VRDSRDGERDQRGDGPVRRDGQRGDQRAECEQDERGLERGAADAGADPGGVLETGGGVDSSLSITKHLVPSGLCDAKEMRMLNLGTRLHPLAKAVLGIALSAAGLIAGLTALAILGGVLLAWAALDGVTRG
jgi:hypothetical protein